MFIITIMYHLLSPQLLIRFILVGTNNHLIYLRTF